MSLPRWQRYSFTIAKDGTYSSWIQPPNWFTFCMVYFPAMDNGAIGIDLTIDGGSTVAPMLKADGSGDAVVCASGSDPAFIDISDYIRAMPTEDTLAQMRFTCAAQTTAAVTGYIYFKQ